MFKSFCKLVKTLVPATAVISYTQLCGANFSVDNSNQEGLGSLTEVIKASNAIYPGIDSFNSLIFRSNLLIDQSYPDIRNNVNFNILDSYFVTISSVLNSSAEFAKSGKGTLEIKAPLNFQGDWKIIEGTLIKNSLFEPKGRYIVSGDLESKLDSLGTNAIILAGGGLILDSEGSLNNLITIDKNGRIDTRTFDIQLKNLKGTGEFIKTGLGKLTISSNSGFQGKYQINEGSLDFKDVLFSGQVLLNGGSLEISSAKNLEGIELILQKGSVMITAPKATLSKSVEAQGSEAVFDLNNANFNLSRGFQGWGIIDFNGPGILEMGAKEPFSGHLKFHNLTFNPTKLSKNTVYKFDNVTLNFGSISEIDFTTRFSIDPGKTVFIYKEKPVILNAPLEGKGNIEASGQGEIIVRSLTPYQGKWTQALGQLNLEGLLNAVDIEKSASIKGAGTIINDLNLKGVLFPFINSANTQNILKTQAADLKGSIIIMPEIGVYTKGDYQILNANELNFSEATLLAPAQFEGVLSQKEDKLNFSLEKFYLLADFVDQDNIDDRAVASSFDNYYALPGTDKDNILRKLLTLKNDPVQFEAAFQGLQPAYFSALGLTQEYNFILARSTLSNRMEELLLFPCAKQYVWDEPFAFWVDPVGDFTQQEPRQQDMGYHAATVGAFFGFDGKVGSSFRLGLLGGYTNSRVRWMEDVGKGIINSEYLAGYFLYKPNRFYLNGSISGSYSHYNATRNINIVDIHRQARHKNHGFGYEADFEIGYVFKGKTHLQPYLRQSYIGLYQQKFQEHGGGSLDLNVDSKQFAMYRIDAGFIFSRCLDYENLAITPEISLSGIWEQELKTGTFQATYQDTAQSYEVVGMKPRRLLISPGAALDFVIKKYPIMIGARYHAEFSSQFIDQRISGHIGYGF